MRLCVIPARGGSKRIPRKNIKAFRGQPIIAYSIETALRSTCFDRVIVSTDDNEIADVAKAHGAEVPFIRPAALSDDHADTASVIQHAIAWMDEHHGAVSEACCIYATAPFLQPDDIQGALAQLLSASAEYCFSVAQYPYPIQRALRISGEQRVEMLSPELVSTRSQDLEEMYHDAGQFYWGTADAWRSGRPILSPQSAPYLLPAYRVQDIDTNDDWARAEYMFDAIAAQDNRT